MNSTALTTLPLFFFLAACAPQPPVITEAEALQQLSPAKWQVQREIPMESTANVAIAADIKAYPVGRYVDAANPNVLHERHTIYRRESPESWRRDTDRGHGILLGPTVGLRNPVARKNPASQELTAELNRQRLVTQRLIGIERSSQAGDAQAAALLSEAQTIQATQAAILKKLDGYEKQQKEAPNAVDLPVTPKFLSTPKTELNPVPNPESSPVPLVEPKPKN
jgi:hypothetical protein